MVFGARGGPPRSRWVANMGWKEFCRALFEHAEGQVFFQSLGNSPADNQHPRELISRNPGEIAPFLAKWDRPGRGMFVCVSTLKDGVHKRNKENVRQVTGLHADIDFKGIDETGVRETGQQPGTAGEAAGLGEPGGLVRHVLSLLLALPSPPSVIVNSGHGIHAYWLFHEPMDVADSPELVEQIERTLHLLADLVAGDPAVCEVSRLMRLPGTRNTKRGGKVPVEILHLSAARYELSDVEDMLNILSPVLRRKQGEASKNTDALGAGEQNPWLLAAQASGFKPPLDVEAMLSNMTLGGGPSGIHQTQVRVSAALLTRGHTVAEVTDVLLAATQRAAGEYGARWNWAREAKKIRQACEGWLRKHPQPTQNESGAAMSEGAGDGETGEGGGGRTVVPFTGGSVGGSRTTEAAAGAGPSLSASGGHGPEAAGAHQGAPSTGEPAEPGAVVVPITQARTAAQARLKDVEGGDKLHKLMLAMAQVTLSEIAKRSERLMLHDGEVWHYSDGVWRPISPGVVQRIKALIQYGLNQAGVNPKVNTKGQVWSMITEDMSLLVEAPPWNEKLLICKNVSLDLSTLMACDGFPVAIPHAPEQYARRQINAAYDPAAECPMTLAYLRDMFADRADGEARLDTLQEFFGAALATRLLPREARKGMILYGPSSSGKSEVARLLTMLLKGVGTTIASVMAGKLGKDFALGSFHGAAAWICDEAGQEGEFLDAARFKVIVTGEPVSIEKKHRDAFTEELNIPVLLTMNVLPRIKDKSNAVFNRQINMAMTRVFSPEEAAAWRLERGITSEKPSQWLFEREASGLLNWALQGLYRLIKRGGMYDLPESVIADGRAYAEDSNPIQAWAREAVALNPEKMVARHDLLCAYNGYVKETLGGEARAAGSHYFLSAFRSVFPNIEAHTNTSGQRFFVGVEMTELGLNYWENHKLAPLTHGERGISETKPQVNRPGPKRYRKGDAKQHFDENGDVQF